MIMSFLTTGSIKTRNKMETTDDGDIRNFLHLYDIRLLADVPDDLLCSICRKVVINACFGPCSCQYCAECIKTYLDNSQDKRCPGESDDCRTFSLDYDSDIKPDNRTECKIRKLRVKCPNESCCSVKDTIGNMARHVTTCGCVTSNCPYFSIGCEFVSSSVVEIEQHLETEAVNHSQILMESVIKLRNQMDSWQFDQLHRNQMDRLTNTANQLQIDSRTMNVRIDELELLIKSLYRQILINRESVDIIEDEQNLSEKTDELLIVVEQSGENAAEQGGSLAAGYDRASRLNERAACVLDKKSDILVQIEALSKKLSELKLKTALEIKNIKMNVVGRLNNLEQRMRTFEQMKQEYCANFVWKVKQLGQLRRNSLDGKGGFDYSNAFYSHGEGYKMRLFIQFKSATNIFIGFQIMRGESDDVLSWPFKGRIIISALSYDNRDDVVTESYHYDNVENEWKHSFNKPTCGNNKVYGTNNFLAWTELKLNKNVYKKDCIILRCRIVK